jgi:hypothetical protein
MWTGNALIPEENVTHMDIWKNMINLMNHMLEELSLNHEKLKEKF